MITVARAGPLSTVQDLGRPGWAHLGVPRSGALDQPALRRANALVGNPAGAAGLELTFGGCVLRFDRAATIALTGAPVRDVAFDAPFDVPAGTTVRIGRPTRGLRTYVAVAGGVDVPAVLGSRSTDTLSGLGPAPLRDGSSLDIGDLRGSSDVEDLTVGDIVLRVRLGPRDDRFTDVAGLFADAYTIGVNSNRVGARLAGRALTRAVAGELPSEGIVLGAVQVPTDGQPLVFLADHPTTGGYPVVGVVEAADLPLLAQGRPGDQVRFEEAGWT